MYQCVYSVFLAGLHSAPHAARYNLSNQKAALHFQRKGAPSVYEVFSWLGWIPWSKVLSYLTVKLLSEGLWGCVVSAMMSRVYHNSSGNNNHLSWFLWLVQALGPQGLQKMGLCFMTLEKLPAEKLCARFYCHSTHFCTDHGETKLAQPTKSFTFSSGLRLHQFSKLPLAKLMVLFYSIFLMVIIG